MLAVVVDPFGQEPWVGAEEAWAEVTSLPSSAAAAADDGDCWRCSTTPRDLRRRWSPHSGDGAGAHGAVVVVVVVVGGAVAAGGDAAVGRHPGRRWRRRHCSRRSPVNCSHRWRPDWRSRPRRRRQRRATAWAPYCRLCGRRCCSSLLRAAEITLLAEHDVVGAGSVDVATSIIAGGQRPRPSYQRALRSLHC